MKKYRITVNGNEYDVEVEELVEGAVSTPNAATSTPKPVSKPVQKKESPSTGNAGTTKISSPMPGKILQVKASAGTAIKKGQVILILEAMKMENEIVAPEDGTIASINVTVGQTVEAGELLASLN